MMKKTYEAPLAEKITLSAEEALMASIIPGEGEGTEIGPPIDIFG